MINSEKRKYLHDCYQSHILFHQTLFINVLTVVFSKFSDVKPINLRHQLKKTRIDDALYKLHREQHSYTPNH